MDIIGYYILINLFVNHKKIISSNIDNLIFSLGRTVILFLVFDVTKIYDFFYSAIDYFLKENAK